LALSRPDVSCVLRQQKQTALKSVAANGAQEILTTCPSCVAGLSKQTNGRRVYGKALVVEVAERTLGAEWERAFVVEMRERGVEEVLF
jgi:Fe-S oxidoreductase